MGENIYRSFKMLSKQDIYEGKWHREHNKIQKGTGVIILRDAFKKTKESSNLDVPGNLSLISDDHYQEGLKLAVEVFTRDEPLNRSIGLQWCQDLETMFITVFRQNISLLLTDELNKNIMAILVIGFDGKEKMHRYDTPTDPVYRKIFEFLKYCDRSCDVFKRFDVEEVCHFYVLAVHDSYRHKHIGLKLVQFGFSFIYNLGVHPLVFKTEATSMYSQKIFQKLGFHSVFETEYQDYKVNGQNVFKNMGNHKSVKIMCKL